MSNERISLKQEDGIAVVKFKHPEVLNAIGAQMLSELTDAVSQIAAPDSGVRCVLLTGEGRGFSAGANLSDSSRKSDAKRKGGTGSSLRTGYHPLLFTLRDLDLEAKLQTEAGRTSDHKKDVQAFLEKRTAKFTGN